MLLSLRLLAYSSRIAQACSKEARRFQDGMSRCQQVPARLCTVLQARAQHVLRTVMHHTQVHQP